MREVDCSYVIDGSQRRPVAKDLVSLRDRTNIHTEKSWSSPGANGRSLLYGWDMHYVQVEKLLEKCGQQILENVCKKKDLKHKGLYVRISGFTYHDPKELYGAVKVCLETIIRNAPHSWSQLVVDIVDLDHPNSLFRRTTESGILRDLKNLLGGLWCIPMVIILGNDSFRYVSSRKRDILPIMDAMATQPEALEILMLDFSKDTTSNTLNKLNIQAYLDYYVNLNIIEIHIRESQMIHELPTELIQKVFQQRQRLRVRRGIGGVHSTRFHIINDSKNENFSRCNQFNIKWGTIATAVIVDSFAWTDTNTYTNLITTQKLQILLNDNTVEVQFQPIDR